MSKKQSQSGFTIIELMIATVVFSIVMLVLTGAIIQIGRLYYKSITAARTQSAARSIMDDAVQVLQLDSGGITQGSDLNIPAQGLVNQNTSRAICIANHRYSFIPAKQRTATQHAFVRDNVSAGCSVTTPAQNLMTGTVAGEDLLGDKMRLSRFEVTQIGTSNTYRVTVRVIYGDDDLLCSPKETGVAAASCTSTAAMSSTQVYAANENNHDLQCKNIRAGTQFCAMSELSTIVERRME